MSTNSERMIIVLNDMFNPPKEFTDKRLAFSVPQPTTENDRNTLVTISGVPGKGYYGEVDVYYNRMDIAQYAPGFEFRSLTELNRGALTQALINLYSIQINPEDFVDFTPPALADGESVELTMTIEENSLQWFGSITAALSFGPSWLDSVIGRADLDIYKHPNTYQNRQSSRMWTWGADFSGIQAALKPNAKGDYTDWTLVQSVCRQMGMPDFLKGKVIDRATVDVPDANQAFQRVVIQTAVTSGQLSGALYFHYNPA